MADIGHNEPVEAHGENVVDISTVAQLFWTYGLVQFRGQRSQLNDNNRYALHLSGLTAEQRREYWANSIDREHANGAVLALIDDDELYQQLEQILQANLTRYHQNTGG